MKDTALTPALRFHWLTRFYDAVLAATLKEDAFKRMLIEQAHIQPNHQVLDLGCGTATLAIMLKQAHPTAIVKGLDGDPAVLELARAKIDNADLQIGLHEGMTFDPPFAPRQFDRIVSSLVFHHLSSDNKRRTLRRVRELLRTGGELHIADWGEAQDWLMRLAFVSVQMLDGFATTSDNVYGQLLPMIRDAGFEDVRETHRARTIFGTLSLYRAVAG